MSDSLLIVFVKNIKLGKVKTRLAKTIGNDEAFNVYKELVEITANAIAHLPVDKRIYFSDSVVDTKWVNDYKTVQVGEDLGERMKNAFIKGFADGYKNVILIGSDLPDISQTIILNGFEELHKSDVVFGPALDGGYYLIGMKQLHASVFENKPWSKSHLLKTTLKELETQKRTISLIEPLNDIDTFEDLKTSSIYKTLNYD